MLVASKRSSYIDQWRGLSVLLVIANHLILFRFNGALLIDKGTAFLPKVRYKILWFVDLWGINAGMVGVCIFFVISGYLITYLMLKEEDQFGLVSLRAFYARRIFRIIPALLLYILGICLLNAAGAIQTYRGEILASSLFLCNTTAVTCGYHFNQLWSLAVEEQFYLCWPLLFIIARRWRIWLVSTAIIAAAVLACIPATRIHGWLNNGECFACICAGVLYALSVRARAWLDVTRKLPTWMWAALLAFVIPFLRTRWIALDAPIMLALPPVIVATVLARSGSMVPSMAGRVLRGIGLMSYSLYLWQGIFTWYPQTYMARWFAYGSTAGIAIAWLSYRYVEIHFIRLGHQLSRRLQKAVVPAAISVAPQ